MKILHISECIKGGVATYINDLYKYKRSNYDYHLFCPKSELPYLSKEVINQNNYTLFNKKKETFTF